MSSNIIILCPQTAPTTGNNPNACRGWFDFNRCDPRYAQKNGRQMFAVKRMIDRIAGAEKIPPVRHSVLLPPTLRM
jgi:hypothetical protein